MRTIPRRELEPLGKLAEAKAVADATAVMEPMEAMEAMRVMEAMVMVAAMGEASAALRAAASEGLVRPVRGSHRIQRFQDPTHHCDRRRSPRSPNHPIHAA